MELLLIFLALIRLPCVLDESRHRHRTDTTRSWCDSLHIVFQIIEIRISLSDSSFERIAHVDNDRILSHHIARDESW